jgi:glycosyltransferase involved in cell wall biosynthesis
MKVLVVAGLYSGLADSLATGRWQPSGVPAIYRLAERLASNPAIDASFVFLSRGFDPRFSRTRRLSLAPLGPRVWVLPWRPWPVLDRLGLGNIAREGEQALRVLLLTLRLRPHAAYCANAAYAAAGLIARLGLAPVVLRFLGIFEAQKRLAAGHGPGLVRWLYRSPFARAVCTLEGSGAEHHLPRLLRPGTPLEVLLNGVDRPHGGATGTLRPLGLPVGLPVIGFVGRLEAYKGCEEFIEALAELERVRPGSFAGLVVGGGALADSLRDRVAGGALAARVRFTGAVPHAAVSGLLAGMDIYVSLNRNGNLSNANLEAMAAGRCMVMLESDPARHIDVATDRLVPPAVVERVSRQGTAASLAAVLRVLLDTPAEVERRATALAALARDLLPDWETRVMREISIIESVVHRRAAAAEAPLTR